MQAPSASRFFLAVCCALLLAACGGGGSNGTTDPGGDPGAPETEPTGGATTWLERLNMMRSWAGLAPVTEDGSLTTGCVNHSRYMVKNDVIAHTEDGGNAWFTAAGLNAAMNSNLHVSSPAPSDLAAAWAAPLNGWMTGPFHGIGMIDPRLLQSAYGQYAETLGTWHFGAALDVLSNTGPAPGPGAYPIMWPGNGTTIDIRAYMGNESPDPLVGSGYTAPTGPPIYLQLGDGTAAVNVTASSFMTGGNPLPHHRFDQNTYAGPPPGPAILAARNCVVLMPQSPLAAGATYDVSITNNGTPHTWSFTVSASAPKPAALLTMSR